MQHHFTVHGFQFIADDFDGWAGDLNAAQIAAESVEAQLSGMTPGEVAILHIGLLEGRDAAYDHANTLVSNAVIAATAGWDYHHYNAEIEAEENAQTHFRPVKRDYVQAPFFGLGAR